VCVGVWWDARERTRANVFFCNSYVYVVPIDAFGEAPLLAAPENPSLVSGGETDEIAHCRMHPL
jgi:hypothetical protein